MTSPHPPPPSPPSFNKKHQSLLTTESRDLSANTLHLGKHTSLTLCPELSYRWMVTCNELHQSDALHQKQEVDLCSSAVSQEQKTTKKKVLHQSGRNKIIQTDSLK